MSEILKNNPTALRARIYYEFLREKNVEEAYKNFCKTVGDGVIEYVDFEYWFYRFYHGNLDMDHERSSDPKPLILTDLPIEMLNEIVGNLDIRNRFNVRKVSRKLENVVDGFKQEFENVSIYTKNQVVEFRVRYEKGKNDSFVQFNYDEDYTWQLNIELSDLSAVLTNSKSPIDCFSITTHHHESIYIMPKLIDALSKEVCPIFYAKRVELMSLHNDFIIPILSLFKPGVLEHLNVRVFKCDDVTFARLVEMDQFKQLKSIEFYVYDPISLSQFKRLSHLTTFEGYVEIGSAEDIVILRDILSQFANLKSAKFSLCDFSVNTNLSEIGTSLGIDYDNSGQITYRHPIPNSDKSLILNINWCSIEVNIENN